MTYTSNILFIIYIYIYLFLGSCFIYVILFQKMLNLISDRLERGMCDDVLEVAWSTMWNVTDETPQNCQRFLDNRGMEYFLACLKVSNWQFKLNMSLEERVQKIKVSILINTFSISMNKTNQSTKLLAFTF